MYPENTGRPEEILEDKVHRYIQTKARSAASNQRKVLLARKDTRRKHIPTPEGTLDGALDRAYIIVVDLLSQLGSVQLERGHMSGRLFSPALLLVE